MSYRLFRVGKIWHYRFSVDGKRTSKTTRQTQRTAAEQIAEKAYREAASWAVDGRVMPTLHELAGQWIEVHALTASESHLQGMERFRRLHLGALRDTPINSLTTAIVETARNEMLRTHSAGSANHWLKQIRLLCSWAVRRDLIPARPFRVSLLKVQQKPKVTLSTALAGAWLAAVDSNEAHRVGIRIAVRLMLGAGLRESETTSASWEWIDWDRRLYTPGKTKGREATAIPVPGWLLDFLATHRQESGLIVTRPNGRPYQRGFSRPAILAANRAVGAPHVTPHRLRGTFATLLSESGTPVQDIQRVLRHKDVRTTLGYLEHDIQRVANAQEKIATLYGFNAKTQECSESATKITQAHA